MPELVDLSGPRVLTHWSKSVPTIVVEVMPKAELLDPQGKAVTGALSRMGRTVYSEVRIGKRFELIVDEVTDEVLADVKVLADDVFSNSVIEDVVSITVADAPVSA
jgi:phosphoribosylformylglycinamidine (FGAM) synthase PurS component